MNRIVATAVEYLNHGLSVIPTNSQKQPTIPSWVPFQRKIASVAEVEKWWVNNNYSIAIICGAVSDNLEIIDFDEKHNIGPTLIFDQWKELVEVRSPGLIDKLVIQTTVNNGFHVIYRCDEMQGNQKLAQRPSTTDEIKKDKHVKSLTLIETRGEGGYFLCYPSQGYSLIQGTLKEIHRITADERDVLLSSARSLSTLHDSKSLIGDTKGVTDGNRPGDDFNRNGNHKELLESNGWKFECEKYGSEYWCRPGKEHGISASFNAKIGTLYVFSSNASPLEVNTAYSKFSLFAHLEANGDYTLAARKLGDKGFGEKFDEEESEIKIQKVENYLRKKYCFRRNVVTTKIEITTIGENSFTDIDDMRLNSLERELKKKKLSFGINPLHRLLGSDFVESYDPFVSYFKNLKKWDGATDYIELLARTVTLIEGRDAEDFKNVLQKWLVAMIACAIEENSVNQAAIILVGGQGIGKSRWLNKLVPSELSKHLFVGNINPMNKDAVVYLSECLLINLDELESLSQFDIGALKSLMTQQVIKVRRPYDRLPQNMIRRASFVGSINKTEFLDDPTGTRRFLTFEVKSCHVESMPNMDNVMAQAYSLFNNGERWWFDDLEIMKINERNIKFANSSYEEELLLDVSSPWDGEETNVQWLKASNIAEKIKAQKPNFKIDGGSVRNIGRALVKNKYPSKKINGQKLYGLKGGGLV